MAWLRLFLLRLPVLLAAALSAPVTASEQEASPWGAGLHSRVRLVGAGSTDGGARLAGLVIRLDPGFKTYWRDPGESGLPPVFDWSGSSNLGGVQVLWPAPTRIEDIGGVSYGYADRVVLPLRVTPQRPGEPVGLALKLDYGVCKEICIPARAELALELTSAGDNPEVSAALARVPEAKPLGAAGELSVLAVEPTRVEGKPMIAVAVRAPAEAQPQLFVEAPEPWFLAPAGAVTPAAGSGAPPGAMGSFLIEIAERPKEASGPLALRLTLVAGDRAVETAASLDSDRLPR